MPTCTITLLVGAARDIIIFFFWPTKAESAATANISSTSRLMTNRQLALGKIICCVLANSRPPACQAQRDAAYVYDQRYASHPSAHQGSLSSPTFVLSMFEITVPICARVYYNFTKLILADESVDLL